MMFVEQIRGGQRVIGLEGHTIELFDPASEAKGRRSEAVG